MTGKIWGAAALGFCLTAGAQAQTLAEISGPANPPPASFRGQQFVDSRGCAFLRAGFGGQVNWVPRIDGARKPICGLLPTGAAPAAVVAETPRGEMPDPAPKAQGGKGLFAFLFAPAPKPAPQPAAKAAPAEPVLTFTEPLRRSLPKPPKGWSYAWKDDRLNPMRGIGTPAGEAAQDRVWTREVPMEMIADLPKAKEPKVKPAPSVTVTTASAVAEGPMIQVGAFGDPANAQRSRGRIADLGLPFATQSTGRLQVVLAGPFGSDQAAHQALAALRAAGFAEAFLR